MRSRVYGLLRPTANTRRTLTLSLDGDQLEMVDKLVQFFSKQTGQKTSRNQVIEEAVNGFIDESVDVIQEQFSINIRMIPLAELARNQYGGGVNVAELDTVIVPAKDNEEYRESFFIRREWPNVRIVEEKLRRMRYIAVYVGAPTSGITHYAQIAGYRPDENRPGRYVIRIQDGPIQLPNVVECGDAAAAAGMRSCRYTALHLLEQATALSDLFPVVD